MFSDIPDYYRKQPDNDSCGPTVVKMLLAKHGLPPIQGEGVEELTTNECSGTGNGDLLNELKKYFSCEVRVNATIDDLREAFNAGYDIVVNYLVRYDPADPIGGENPHHELFCAENSTKLPKGEAKNWDGHYSLVRGFSDADIHLLDPRGNPNQILTFKEFVARWRAYYGLESGWAIFVRPKQIELLKSRMQGI